MIDVHQNGWTKTILDRDQREVIQQTMFDTFEDRFDGVSKLLKVRCCLLTISSLLLIQFAALEDDVPGHHEGGASPHDHRQPPYPPTSIG